MLRENSGDLASQRCKSPINPLSVESPAPESSVCGLENRHERTEEAAYSSVPLNCQTEHEQATLEAESALKGQEATESLLESPSSLQKDTQDTPDAPDSTRSGDLQAEPQDTPDARLDGEGGGEERSDSTDRCEASPQEATNSALKSASYFEIQHHNAHPFVQDEGKKGQ
jgi:hypothetical protein